MPNPLVIGGRYLNAQVERYAPGDRLPCEVQTGQAVTGGMVVGLTDDDLVVAKCGAAATNALGVGLWDVAADLDERELTVATEGVWSLPASGSINAGDWCVTAANGAVSADNTPTPGTVVGKATSDAAGGRVDVKLFIG